MLPLSRGSFFLRLSSLDPPPEEPPTVDAGGNCNNCGEFAPFCTCDPEVAVPDNMAQPMQTPSPPTSSIGIGSVYVIFSFSMW